MSLISEPKPTVPVTPTGKPPTGNVKESARKKELKGSIDEFRISLDEVKAGLPPVTFNYLTQWLADYATR